MPDDPQRRHRALPAARTTRLAADLALIGRRSSTPMPQNDSSWGPRELPLLDRQGAVRRQASGSRRVAAFEPAAASALSTAGTVHGETLTLPGVAACTCRVCCCVLERRLSATERSVDGRRERRVAVKWRHLTTPTDAVRPSERGHDSRSLPHLRSQPSQLPRQEAFSFSTPRLQLFNYVQNRRQKHQPSI
jgi:hypothetical protein